MEFFPQEGGGTYRGGAARYRHSTLFHWLLAIGFWLFAKRALLIQNKLNPAPDFIVSLLTFSPAQVPIKLAGIFVSGLAF